MIVCQCGYENADDARFCANPSCKRFLRFAGTTVETPVAAATDSLPALGSDRPLPDLQPEAGHEHEDVRRPAPLRNYKRAARAALPPPSPAPPPPPPAAKALPDIAPLERLTDTPRVGKGDAPMPTMYRWVRGGDTHRGPAAAGDRQFTPGVSVGDLSLPVDPPNAQSAPDSPGGGHAVARQELHATIDRDALDVAAGANASVVVSVHNAGSLVENVRAVVQGLPETWVTVRPAELVLDTGATGAFTIDIHPKRDSSTSPGRRHVEIDAVSSLASGVTATVSTEVTVGSFSEPAIAVSPTNSEGRRFADHTVMLDNSGNVELVGMLRGVDPDARLRFAFNAVSLRIPPGERREVGVRVIPSRSILSGAPQSRPFNVVFEQEGGQSLVASAAIVQQPVISRTAGRLIGALGIVALLAGALTFKSVIDHRRSDPKAMPTVVGAPEAGARASIEKAAGRRAAQVVTESIEVPGEDGKVVQQDPAAGTPLKGVSKVVLYVGRPVLLEDLKGMLASEAADVVTKLKLEVDQREEANREVPPGRVARTAPPAGPVKAGTKITLFISTGPDFPPMPVLTNRDLEAAIAALPEQLRSTLSIKDRVVTDSGQVGKILEQTPAPNTPLSATTAVVLTVGKAANTVAAGAKVPVNRTIEALRAGNATIGVIAISPNDQIPQGWTVSIAPDPVRAGAKADLVVSGGPAIPRVLDQTKSEAVRLLQEKGFSVASAPQCTKDPKQVDRVMTQSPLPGKWAPKMQVTLYVGSSAAGCKEQVKPADSPAQLSEAQLAEFLCLPACPILPALSEKTQSAVSSVPTTK